MRTKAFRFSSKVERSDIVAEIFSKRIERALKLIERCWYEWKFIPFGIYKIQPRHKITRVCRLLVQMC